MIKDITGVIMRILFCLSTMLENTCYDDAVALRGSVLPSFCFLVLISSFCFVSSCKACINIVCLGSSVSIAVIVSLQLSSPLMPGHCATSHVRLFYQSLSYVNCFISQCIM